VLVSTLTIGLPPARNGDGDGAAADSPAARFVTAVAQRAFGGNDAEGALRAWQEHCAEEFANLRCELLLACVWFLSCFQARALIPLPTRCWTLIDNKTTKPGFSCRSCTSKKRAPG
jgi:hypothetical protein